MDAKFLAACAEMAIRVGCTKWQLRYQDQQEPTIWIAYAEYGTGEDCAAALTAPHAAFRLLEQVVDGNTCSRCDKPMALLEIDEQALPSLIEAVCWHTYSPTQDIFISGCAVAQGHLTLVT